MGNCMAKVQEDLYVRRFAPDHDPHSFSLSRRIERQLKTQEQEDKNMIKLLLLGSGNSGKSTVMKQFKIIHKRGFTAEERRAFRDALWKSAIEAMRSLVKARQDYISAARLLEPDADLPDELLRERELIDQAMEPYFQYLLHRVRDDIPMFEEVVIAVAAEPHARTDPLSPIKDKKEPVRESGFTPLLTSNTILLSSPPVTERKGPLDGEVDYPDEDLHVHGDELLLPPSRLETEDSDSGSVEAGSKRSGSRSRVGINSTIGGLSPIADVTPEMHSFPGSRFEDDDDLEEESRLMLNHADRTFLSTESHEQFLGPSADADLSNHHAEVGFDESLPLDKERYPSSLPVSEGESAGSAEHMARTENIPSTIGGGQQEGESSFANEEQLPTKKRSKERKAKRTFTSPEEEAEYLAKQERRRRKKKKKERSKRRQQEGLEMDFTAKSDLERKKKPIYCSSVESMRSDLSRTDSSKNAAPLVVWEKITIGRLLQKIWMDPLIQRMYALEEKSPQLEAPLGYIMNAMDRISEQGFTPTNEDILFSRKRTSGVNLLDFEAYGARFLLIDVGGQRTERKKWLAHFDIVDAVIFVVGLDQYDQVMMEDGVTNRLRDSLELFEEMCSSPWFRGSSFLLFLNKSDVFKTKIKQVPLTVCFRGYQGDPYDYDQCSKFIIRRFQQIHNQYTSMYRDSKPHGHRRRGGRQAIPHVYPYMTNATDTESMRFLFDTCQDILLRSEMAQWGFFDF